MTESMSDVTSRIQCDRNPKDVETLDLFRRRIQFRAWHRGTSEADLLLGGFVDRCVHSLTSAELRMLDRLLEVDDPIIDDWARGRRATPTEYDNGVLEAFRRFCLASTHRGGSYEQRPHGD
jgi:antitoxin CptB